MKQSAHRYAIFIALIVMQLLIHTSKADSRPQLLKQYCDEGINNETTFTQNFVFTMQSLVSQLLTSHNATAATGTGVDRNYGLANCYRDLSLEDCTICYSQMRTLISRCAPRTGSRIYLDGCFLRLQNYSFWEEYTGPLDSTVCGNTTRKSNMFQELTNQTVMNAVTNALTNSDYFAREEVVRAGSNDSVYVLAECWNTLSPSSCRACLMNASESLITKCLPWSEGRALNTGCFMRYSDTNFLNPIVASTSPEDEEKITAAVVSAISSAVVFILIVVIVIYIRKRRYIQQRRKDSYDAEKQAKILNDISLNFKYSTLEKATGNWDESNKLGEGGFGMVYKGVLQDGREIAVKRLFLNHKLRVADFYNEVNMISSVQHKNLVRLLGCSCSGPESILVYEYLPNMSLDQYIFDEIKGKELRWERRFEIIIGIAEGVVYLHENTKSRIIHRDIKASNILLDLRFCPKIADFGLARSFQDDKSHISTAIAGTLGYIAPEYLARGQLTEKADVYSFGVLLLEIVTGMENNRSKITDYTDSLVSTAWKHFNQGTVEEIFDPNLRMYKYPNILFQKDAKRVVHVGLLCIQEAPSLRPSMSAALRMLARDDEPLPIPSDPPFIDDDTMEFSIMTQTLLGSSVGTLSRSDIYPSVSR